MANRVPGQASFAGPVKMDERMSNKAGWVAIATPFRFYFILFFFPPRQTVGVVFVIETTLLYQRE